MTDHAISLLNTNKSAPYTDKVKIIERFSRVNEIQNKLEFLKIYLALKKARVLNLTLG